MDIQYGQVEVKWRVRRKAVARLWFEHFRAPVHKTNRIFMREHHALGLAGRARRIKNVGKVARVGHSRFRLRHTLLRVCIVERLAQAFARSGTPKQKKRRQRAEFAMLDPELLSKPV